MKTYRFLDVILILVIIVLYARPLHGDTDIAVIPGDIKRICTYTDFSYNYHSDDFFYYLNERLLFTDRADGYLAAGGLRNRLLKIVHWHGVIKKSLQRAGMKKTDIIAINVADYEGYRKASIIMNLLGLCIEQTPGDQYRVTRNPSSGLGLSDYSRFALFNTDTIEKQLNKTRHFFLKIPESKIHVPWDFGFLQEITGLDIDSASFFETMLKNERFSLLLGILYRLSYKEINYINHLEKSPRFGAWKRIYKYKRFLMGMFFLSNALRVTDYDDGEDSQWVLPGGRGAAPFWTRLAGVNYKKDPMGFLYRLATKDEGKLNYLFLFSQFLSPGAQKALFTGSNAKKMQEVYDLISLEGSEKLKKSQFPKLRDSNFYTLLYSLRMRDNRFYFPLGADYWLKMNDFKKLSIPYIADNEDVLKVVDETVIIAKNVEKIKEISKLMEESKLAMEASEEAKDTSEEEIGETIAEMFEDSVEEEEPKTDIDTETRKISIDMGIKVGMCASNLNFSEDSIDGWKTAGNFLLGAFFTFNISKTIMIQPELYYVVKGAAFSHTYGGESFKQRVKLDYIEAPLLVKIKLPVKGTPALLAGFYGALNIGARAITQYSGENRKESIKEEIQQDDYGFVVGTNIDFRMRTRKLILDIRYSTSLTNIRKSTFTNYKVRNNVFYFMMGLEF